jgi:hypothetical protein
MKLVAGRGLWLVALAACQPPPDHVAGVTLSDLAVMPDLAPAPDLAPPPPQPDLAGYDLTPPSLAGNRLRIDPGPLATIIFNVTDRDTGLPMPSRVIFRPPPAMGFSDNIRSGTWEVNSRNSATGAVVADGVVGSPEGLLLATGFGRVPVPPGSYELFITRGPEYEAADLHLDIKDGEVRRVDAELDRSVDTRGWMAADLHVHTKSSFDSTFPLDRRVISMTSNGVELIVSTDHNVSIDLAPVIAGLGYGEDLVGSVVGDEFNFVSGHGGAYPVTFNADLPEGGIPTWQSNCVPGVGVNCTSASGVFALMHAQYPGTTVVTITHPYWANGDLGYFTNIGWGAGTDHPPPAPLLTAGQFEGLEILNGYQSTADAIGYLITDWMFLLSQGYRVTALGSSDTHKINWVRAGWPRSWLRLPTDKPGEVTGALLADAIRNQRAIASNGPFAELTVDGGNIGDTITPRGATVTVAMHVDAPDWMAVTRVRLYQDARLLHEWVVQPGHRPVFDLTTQETVSGDSWFALQADGDQPLPPDVVGEYAHVGGWEMMPFVITNPVFIDANGDGQWTPQPWSGAPPPFDQFHAFVRPYLDERTTRGIPEGCSPGEIEPPLDAQGMAERYLAPLVNP